MIELHFESRLAASATEVWRVASTMRGVNAELMPLLRMTHPARHADLNTLAIGECAFASWLLLFGLLPIDRHLLQLERVLPGEGFDERSHAWTQKVWVHRRRVLAAADGCVVRDTLAFEPRLALMRPLLRVMVRTVFEHRHRRLRARFGAIDA